MTYHGECFGGGGNIELRTSHISQAHQAITQKNLKNFKTISVDFQPEKMHDYLRYAMITEAFDIAKYLITEKKVPMKSDEFLPLTCVLYSGPQNDQSINFFRLLISTGKKQFDPVEFQHFVHGTTNNNIYTHIIQHNLGYSDTCVPKIINPTLPALFTILFHFNVSFSQKDNFYGPDDKEALLAYLGLNNKNNIFDPVIRVCKQYNPGWRPMKALLIFDDDTPPSGYYQKNEINNR